MSARLTWLVLAPLLFGGGFFNFINVAFTCEGAYGDDVSDEACERIGEAGYRLLVYSGWAPLVVLLVGAPLFWWSQWALSLFNAAVFGLAGVILIGASLLISTEGIAGLFALVWVPGAIVAGVVILSGQSLRND